MPQVTGKVPHNVSSSLIDSSIFCNPKAWKIFISAAAHWRGASQRLLPPSPQVSKTPASSPFKASTGFVGETSRNRFKSFSKAEYQKTMNFAFKQTNKLYERPPTPPWGVLLHKQGALPLHCVSLGDKKIWKYKKNLERQKQKLWIGKRRRQRQRERRRQRQRQRHFPPEQGALPLHCNAPGTW